MKKELIIMLGFRCNMQCRHCVQLGSKNLPVFPSKITERTLKYIKNLYDKKELLTISYWGGEPLLYWNEIKEAVETINAYIPYGRIRHGITTNGKLLTQDKIDFIKANDMICILSYDGIEPTLVRNEVPTDDKINLFMQIEPRNRSVCGVLNAKHPSFKEHYAWLHNKFPQTHIFVRLPAVKDIRTPKEFYDFKDEDIDNSAREFVEYCITAKYLSQKTLSMFKNLFVKGMHPVTFKDTNITRLPLFRCQCGEKKVAVDFEGNVYPCYNCNEVISNVDCEEYTQKENISRVAVKHAPPNCADCEVRMMCGMACYNAPLTEDGKEFIMCGFLRKFNLAFRKYMALHFNECKQTIARQNKIYNDIQKSVYGGAE